MPSEHKSVTFRDKEDRELVWRAFAFSVAIALFCLSCWMIWTLGSTQSSLGMGNTQPFFVLPLIVIFGITALFSALTIASVVIHSMKMSDEHEALGLPKGSIRALIALSLIVIFAIMSIYMQGQLSPYYVKLANGTETFVEPTKAQENFALQTLTTVSTLVVAIAAFYFGTKSVATARGVYETATEIKKITPKSPFELNIEEQQVLYPIIVETTPEGEEVSGEVDKKSGKLEQVKENEFKFVPESTLSNGASVTLKFQIVKNAKATKNLEVKIIKKEAQEKSEITVKPDPIALDGNNLATIAVTTKPENLKVVGETSDSAKGELSLTAPNAFIYKPSDKFGKADTVTLTFTLEKDKAVFKKVNVTKR